MPQSLSTKNTYYETLFTFSMKSGNNHIKRKPDREADLCLPLSGFVFAYACVCFIPPAKRSKGPFLRKVVLSLLHWSRVKGGRLAPSSVRSIKRIVQFSRNPFLHVTLWVQSVGSSPVLTTEDYQSVLGVEDGFMQHIAPAFKAVTPNLPNNPALEPIEKLFYMGFTEIVTPSPYDGVDGIDELEDGQRNASMRPNICAFK